MQDLQQHVHGLSCRAPTDCARLCLIATTSQHACAASQQMQGNMKSSICNNAERHTLCSRGVGCQPCPRAAQPSSSAAVSRSRSGKGLEARPRHSSSAHTTRSGCEGQSPRRVRKVLGPDFVQGGCPASPALQR